jgi:PAS domain S-box-containing protein
VKAKEPKTEAWDVTGDGYVRFTLADAKILAANAPLAHILDWAAGAPDLIGRTMAEVRQCQLAEQAQALLEREGGLHQFLCFWRTHQRREKKVLVDARVHDDARLGRVVDLVVKDISALTLCEEVCEAEHRRFLVMLQSIGEAVVTTDVAGYVMWLNPAAERLTGWTQAEAAGRPVAEIYKVVEGHSRQAVPNPIPRILQGDVRGSGVGAVLLTRDGREVPVADSGAPLRDGAGQLLGAVVMFHDDTERREAHRALRESSQVFRAIFMRAGIGMVLTDLRGTMLDTNQALQDMLGYTAGELYGRPFSVVTHPDDAAAAGAALRKISDAGPSDHRFQMDQRYLRKDGSIVWGRLTATMICDAEGQPLFGVSMVEDITHMRQADAALETEKERLLVTLRSIGDGVIATDADGRVQLLNRAAEKLIGWTQREAAGRPLDEVFTLLDTETRQPLGADVLRSLIQTGAFAAFPELTLLRTRGGNERHIAEVAAPIRDPQGAIFGLVITFRDVTETRQQEEDFVRNQKLESLGVLAGGIAHDFNNILTAILGNVALLRAVIQGADEKLLLEEVEKASWRAKDLTQQLLTFAKGGLPIKKALALAPLIQESAQFAVRGSNCICEFHLAADLWPVEVDPSQISQVLHNLVINAAQAMANGGTIRLDAANLALALQPELPLKPGAYVQVRVTDQGHGIAERDLPRIFDPYFSTKAKGSGLGLTTAFSIVRKHGGVITVVSKAGAGTTFTVYLPAVGGLPAVVAEPPPATPPSAPAPAQRRILVMDDEAAIRLLARRSLERSGYLVEVAADGAEAVRHYQEALTRGAPFDVVVLDMTIPGGMGGRETLAQLQKIDPAVKAIVSSGYSTDAAMASHREIGFAGVVAKPYRPQELLAVIRQLLGE